MRIPLSRRLGPGQLLALDVVAAVVIGAGALANLLAGVWGAGVARWLTVPVAVLAGLPLALRRPVPAAAVLTGLILSVPAVSLGVGWLPALVLGPVLYTVANTVERRKSLSALGLALAVPLVCNLVAIGARAHEPVTVAWAVAGAGWALGRIARERREHDARSAEQSVVQAITEERLRIARELHDVVAHSMSLIAIKAGVANHVTDTRPEEARKAMRVIEETSRDALAEMRRVLGVLREGGAADLTPAPGISGLPGLVGRSGTRAELDIRGPGGPPAGVGLAVYRIVQEALTNVAKHAGDRACRVVVELTDDHARVEVVNEGERATGGAPPGNGLIGMRERVAAHGGTFSAGPRPEGGFAVRALLPYRRGETT
ncbi:sensor histidine kinase [Allokutzneria albata]|uniref:histidine kinase n=1 Tax=Allokutzneria albata TaxID=211114 RepID=A0A1H0BUQ5_ALLAB|nr:histidine kinase [Allokutzneria albata]SDN49371.1 Signal transduction histidine kinase [Allokutzneria albata]